MLLAGCKPVASAQNERREICQAIVSPKYRQIDQDRVQPNQQGWGVATRAGRSIVTVDGEHHAIGETITAYRVVVFVIDGNGCTLGI